MINKVYEKVKDYIKENYKALLVFIILILVVTVRLPYYISALGGAIDTSEKIKVNTDFEMSGSLNMAYVSEVQGTIPLLLYAMINPDWDIEKEEEVTVGSESIEDEMYRNQMLLEESNDISLLVAYEYSDIDYQTTNNKVYVTYVDDLAKTSLEVGDEIIAVDGNKITEKQDLYDLISDKQVGEQVQFTVIRDKKEKDVVATLINVNGVPKVGVIITETLDIESSHHVDLVFDDKESGSSGGLMMTLTIYSYLNEMDLTNGKKVIGTGTMSRDGTVGEISGVKYKLMGAVKEDADIFLVPKGNNYNEAKKLKEEKGYDIDLVPVETFEEALNYLKNL